MSSSNHTRSVAGFPAWTGRRFSASAGITATKSLVPTAALHDEAANEVAKQRRRLALQPEVSSPPSSKDSRHLQLQPGLGARNLCSNALRPLAARVRGPERLLGDARRC
ncbi:unnamed protein product [Symbiodinium natans]|uniref:Uncharacterized protein n=1 Tax=Symbiodinium natans TaxID=878477 RepID=A0A812G378_9DINO|nr:unnamed protein product [Symbiodinium natans]